MAYIDDEQSAHNGRPRELYAFEGLFPNYYFTSGPLPVEFNGRTYLPVSLIRSDISAGSQEDDGLSITVDMPVEMELVQRYAFQIAPPSLRLTIYRYHDTAEWVPYWQSIIGQVTSSGGIARLRSPSILEHVLGTQLPTVYYQTTCNHVLYDPRCGIDPADWSHEAEILDILGRDKQLEIASIGDLNGQLVGGEAVLATGERRMIVAQMGNTIVVNYPFSQVAEGDIMTVRAGCDYAHGGDCKNRFNNTARFGGFLYIPPDNVFESGIEPGSSVADETCPAECEPEAAWLLNPSFEEGAGVGWTYGPPLTVAGAENGIVPHAGALMASLPNQLAGPNVTVQTLTIPDSAHAAVDAGTAVFEGLSCYATSHGATPNMVQLYIQFSNDGGGLGDVYSTEGPVAAAAWTLQSIAATAVPAGARYVSVVCLTYNVMGDAAARSYFDDFTQPSLALS